MIETGIAWAHTQLGKPYDSTWDGRFGPTGYDCSGFVSQILWHAGMPQNALPTNSADMCRYLQQHPELRLTRAQARVTRGALVLLGGINGYGPAGHVGMSQGDGTTLESRGRTGTGQYRFDDINWGDFMLAPAVQYKSDPTPPPAPPVEDEYMPRLVKCDNGDPMVLLTNSIHSRWVQDEAELKDLSALYGPVQTWAARDFYRPVLVGPAPAAGFAGRPVGWPTR